MKLSMLSHSLPPDMINIVNIDDIQRMAQFISLFYMPYFLQARLSSEASRLDLTLWKHMEVYEKHDTDIADEVKKYINRQLWYLTEECAVFSLCDDGVNDNEKIDLCQSLLAIPRPTTFSPQKPTFPVQILAQNPDNLSLSSFIGSRSWLIFHLLENNGSWLNEPPAEWNLNEEYVDMKSIISSLSVVNDTAERGIKDIEDYANSAKDGQERDQIILVSNSHRCKVKDFLKNEMENDI